MGVIPFKDVKVKNITAKEVYASGDAVGIYMQTKGVLIIDTGEILSESGEMEEPARDIVKREIILWLLIRTGSSVSRIFWRIWQIFAEDL